MPKTNNSWEELKRSTYDFKIPRFPLNWFDLFIRNLGKPKKPHEQQKDK